MFLFFFSRYWIGVALVTAVFFSFPIAVPAETPAEPSQLPDQTGFYYTVQKGDTLWSISKKFFNSPFQWPDLWQKNDQLPNPHWIYPGQKLRLFLKEGVVQFEVVDKGPSPVAAVEPARSSFYHYPSINQVGFIRNPPIQPHGVLFQSKDNKQMISQGDQVYLRPKGGYQLLAGEKYTVYRTFPPVENKPEAEKIGLQHYLVGVVQITSLQPDLAVATVVQSYRNIQVNDLVIPYQSRSPQIFYKKNHHNGLEGHLIIAEEHHEAIGNQMVGFIDKGSVDGVEVGQSYTLYYHEKEGLSRGDREAHLLPAIEFGSFLVLLTEQMTATVLVTRSDRDIPPGTAFRASTK